MPSRTDDGPSAPATGLHPPHIPRAGPGSALFAAPGRHRAGHPPLPRRRYAHCNEIVGERPAPRPVPACETRPYEDGFVEERVVSPQFARVFKESAAASFLPPPDA